MSSTVDVATIVLAELRTRVAALHTVTEPGPASVAAADSDTAAAEDGVADDADIASQPLGGVDTASLVAALEELQGLLTGFSDVLPEQPTATLAGEVGWALSTVRAVQEREDGIDLLDELVDDLDPTLRTGPVAERVGIANAAQRTEDAKTVEAMRGQPEWSSLLEHADALVLTAPLAQHSPKKTARALTSAVDTADRAVREELDSAVKVGDAVTRRAQRRSIASRARHLATTAAAARPVHGKHARRIGDAATELAASLERAVIAADVARRLIDLADRAHRSGEPGFTYGVLHAAARDTANEVETVIASATAQYAKPKLRAWVKD